MRIQPDQMQEDSHYENIDRDIEKCSKVTIPVEIMKQEVSCLTDAEIIHLVEFDFKYRWSTIRSGTRSIAVPSEKSHIVNTNKTNNKQTSSEKHRNNANQCEFLIVSIDDNDIASIPVNTPSSSNQVSYQYYIYCFKSNKDNCVLVDGDGEGEENGHHDDGKKMVTARQTNLPSSTFHGM